MFLTKVLEKKGVIQFFGIALIFSPILSIALKIMLYQNELPNAWALPSIWSFIANSNLQYKILHISSLAIGIQMLRKGATSSWKHALVLVGGHIIMQVLNFKMNYRASKISVVFLVVNILVFAFILDQLVWKVGVPQKKTKPTPAPALDIKNSALEPGAPADIHHLLTGKKRVLIKFEGVGAWAQLVMVSNKGLQLHGIAHPPIGIEKKDVQLTLRNGLKLRARLTQRSGDEFFFEYTYMNSKDLSLLNDWIQNQKKAA